MERVGRNVGLFAYFRQMTIGAASSLCQMELLQKAGFNTVVNGKSP